MKLTKENIHDIVLEELKKLLKEEVYIQNEGWFDKLKGKGKKSPSKSETDLAALGALRDMPLASRSAAKDIEVTGYKDLASKEIGKKADIKSRSYSLEEELENEELDTPTDMRARGTALEETDK